MVDYNLKHLTQPASQAVSGPIQDDEALALYAVIRVMRLRRILEIGGLAGYSAQNFLAATGAEGTVYTVDVKEIQPLATNHIAIRKNARLLTAGDVDGKPLDLVFFDCHNYDVQWELYHRLLHDGIITDATMIALHDTNVHPTKTVPWAYQVAEGWVHVDVERRMVNDLHRMGYQVICLHTNSAAHSPALPYRHGLTLARKFTPLAV